MTTPKTPFVEITLKLDEDLMQELHKEGIEARDVEREVDATLKAFGLTPHRAWELHVLGTQFINKSRNKPEPMKKENVKVLVSSQTEANVLKALLQMLKEPVDNDYFDYYQTGMYLIFSTGTDYADWIIVNKTHSKLPGKNKVEVKDLILLLTATESKPSSILSGKVAIAVSNEREFKLLMEYYERKGFTAMASFSDFYGTYNITSEKGSLSTAVAYGNDFSHSKISCFQREGYTIIPFESFAKEVGIEVPVFVMKSIDGVDMYQGDICYIPQGMTHKPSGYKTFNIKSDYSPDLGLFASKKLCKKHIYDLNRPKHKVVPLFTGMEAHVYGGEILLKDADRTVTTLLPSDLEDMLHAYKSLQP